MEIVRRELFRLQDKKYGTFQAKLIPTIEPETIIGVRTPELRKYAKLLVKNGEAEEFITGLPHQYFDENQLHAFIISEMKDYDRCVDEVNRFLPYVDNWATCDQLSPKVFKKHREELIGEIRRWMASEETYTIRFGIGMLMQHFLDEDFRPGYPEMVAGIREYSGADACIRSKNSGPAADGRPDDYYVSMMIAWYFATALAKQYESIIPYIEEQRLDKWTHNKTIQKSVESYRISPEQKVYLKALKIK